MHRSDEACAKFATTCMMFISDDLLPLLKRPTRVGYMAKDALYEDHPQYKEGMAALREAIKDAATLPNWDAACARTQEWAVKYKDAGGDDSAPRNYFFDMLEAFFPDDHPDFWDALEFWNKRYAIEDTDGDK